MPKYDQSDRCGWIKFTETELEVAVRRRRLAGAAPVRAGSRRWHVTKDNEFVIPDSNPKERKKPKKTASLADDWTVTARHRTVEILASRKPLPWEIPADCRPKQKKGK